MLYKSIVIWLYLDSCLSCISVIATSFSRLYSRILVHPVDKIAPEILLDTFHSIESTATLASCRRVCKIIWNTLAEKAILNHRIDLSNVETA